MKILKENTLNKSKKSLTESVDWDYYNKFESIIDKYLPEHGEGETIAAQIVTAVNKLIYKWYNDGDVFDNTSSNGLNGWSNDLSTYANWLYKRLSSVRPILDRVYDINEDTYEELLKDLADTTLNKEFLDRFADRPALGSIYEEFNGPFYFNTDDDNDFEDEDYYNDDEDDYYDESLNTIKKPVNEELHLHKDFEDNGYVQCVTILLKDESEMPKIEDIMSRKGYYHVMDGDLTAGDFEDVEDDEDLMYSYYMDYEFNTLDEACDFIDNIPSEYEWSIYETDKDPEYDDFDDEDFDFESLASTSKFLDETLNLNIKSLKEDFEDDEDEEEPADIKYMVGITADSDWDDVDIFDTLELAIESVNYYLSNGYKPYGDTDFIDFNIERVDANDTYSYINTVCSAERRTTKSKWRFKSNDANITFDGNELIYKGQ